MKKVEAFIRHEAFEPIRNDLLKLGFPSLSISEVKGSGRQKGITERYRGAELTGVKTSVGAPVPHVITARLRFERGDADPVNIGNPGECAAGF